MAGPNYTSFNTGVSKILFKKVTLDLRSYGTAQSHLGEYYRDRVVLSGRLAF